MWFLPYERLTIETNLSPEEVQRRLEGVVEPKKWFRWPYSRDHEPYQGTWDGNRFKISRIIHYRNSFLPVIQGEIISRYPGTIIELVMRPPIITIGMVILFAGFALLVILRALGLWLSHGANVTSYSSCLFPVMVVLITLISFKVESTKSRKFFRELLEERSSDDWNI